MPASKLDISFSARTKSLAKFKASFPVIIFAQLIADGYNASEAAWAVKFAFNSRGDGATIDATGKRLAKTDSIKQLISYFKEERERKALATNEGKSQQSLDALIADKIAETGEMDKQSTAMEILRIAKSLADGKERAELMMKYADIMGYKKTDEKDTSVRHMHMYLPATCDKCPLYMWYKENYPDLLTPKQLKE